MLLPPAPSGHSLLMGNFMGAVPRSLAGECAGAICSQDPGLLSHPDLSVANSLQEQMSHTLPPPRGRGCVTPPGLGTAASPRHLEVDPCTELGAKPGREQRHVAKTWETHCRSDTPRDGALLGIQARGSGTEDPWSLPAPRAPQPQPPRAAG